MTTSTLSTFALQLLLPLVTAALTALIVKAIAAVSHYTAGIKNANLRAWADIVVAWIWQTVGKTADDATKRELAIDTIAAKFPQALRSEIIVVLESAVAALHNAMAPAAVLGTVQPLKPIALGLNPVNDSDPAPPFAPVPIFTPATPEVKP